MPFTIDQLSAKDEQQLSIEFNDGTVFNYTVSVNRLSFDTYSRLQGLASEIADLGDEAAGKEQAQQGLTLMADLITAWDVVDEKDNPIPITYEAITKLPMTMINKMLSDMMEPLNPNSLSGTSSSNGSAPPTSRKQRRKTAAVNHSQTG